MKFNEYKNKKYTIEQLRQVKGIGEKTLQRIIEQFDENEYTSEYDHNIHIEPNSLVQGDMVEKMNGIPDKSVDLIITSPPYDNLRRYNSNIDYDSLIEDSLRVLRDGGVFVMNINDRVVKGSKTLTSFKVALKFVDKGFLCNDVMIWEKTNPMPQVRQPRYNQLFEYMFVFSKGKPKTFNPIMIPTKSGGQVYDSTVRNIDVDSGRTKKKFVINNEKVDGNIWRFAVAQNKTSHPAVFPETLPEKHIQTWTNKGDVVLDMMMGSGTVPYVAKRMGRKYIGIEISENYFNIAKERILDK